jgi:predicted metalloprotease with PDZ domain
MRWKNWPLKPAGSPKRGYVRIADYLDHELTDVVPVMLYPSHIDFQNNNIMPYLIGEGTGGFTETLKNRVVVPFTGSYAELRHVLTHELVHAFQFNILFNDTSGELLSRFGYSAIPLWYVEGMAEYLSSGFDETADMVMRDVLFNEKYASLEDLTRLRIRLPTFFTRRGRPFSSSWKSNMAKT